MFFPQSVCSQPYVRLIVFDERYIPDSAPPLAFAAQTEMTKASTTSWPAVTQLCFRAMTCASRPAYMSSRDKSDPSRWPSQDALQRNHGQAAISEALKARDNDRSIDREECVSSSHKGAKGHHWKSLECLPTNPTGTTRRNINVSSDLVQRLYRLSRVLGVRIKHEMKQKPSSRSVSAKGTQKLTGSVTDGN